MALFSSGDENEIRQRKAELDRRQADLEAAEAGLAYRQTQHEDAGRRYRQAQAADATVRQESESRLSAREQALLVREQDVTRREVAAAAGFVEQQRAAFKEAVEGRLRTLDQRAAELGELEGRLAEQLEALAGMEGDLSRREMAVHERELKADNGFADKARALVEHSAAREAACEDRERAVRQREAELLEQHRAQEDRAEALRRRAEQLAKAEQERDHGFTELRRKLDEELRVTRRTAEAEVAEYRSSRLAALDGELQSYRAARLAAVAKEEEAERARVTLVIDAERKVIDDERRRAAEEAGQVRKALEELRGNLAGQESDLAYRETLLAAKQDALAQRAAGIEKEVDQRLSQRKGSYEAREKALEAECGRLRAALSQTETLLGCFEELKRRLKDEPERVLLDLNHKTDELRRLREELSSRPTEEMRRQAQADADERKQLRGRIDELRREAADARQRLAGEGELRAKLSLAETENKSLGSRAQLLDAECNRLVAELKQLRAAYEREADRDARIRDVETPHFAAVLPVREKADGLDETQWLDGIARACVDYGLRFHPRILYAFHTALKTAEWSPLTVLAGVSGTGKSELPRLYAHFGGMTFLPLAVQPNWDSQESLLGFFNSIDNKFDAQPVLRFLAQSQKKNGSTYPGLLDSVSMVLLDEMNLAHAELYFAEFLSKLETRRGVKGSPPALQVKLGAGLKPYDLPLGRNVLWAGTMNQDETTKSLSDKVLDRSIVIHFPRPARLERRQVLKPLPEGVHLLPRKVWEGWWMRESRFDDEQIRPFKSFVEDMNASLSLVGRALGHRVWQSIEYYMANYPDVLAAQRAGAKDGVARAMRVAFEDQLVQKVMPKLRGIETRGRSKTDCLDKIRAQLVGQGYAIVDDFDLACEFGYGQFIWQSANYLREPETIAAAAAAAAPEDDSVRTPAIDQDAAAATRPAEQVKGNGSGNREEPQPDLNVPPPHYSPDDPSRVERWKALPLTKRRLHWAKRS